MERVPVAYLRRSRVDPERNDVSWEVQEGAVRDLAAQHGEAEKLVVLSDWNRSGSRGKRRLRPEYQRMLDMVRSGGVSAIYSYSLSRLSRSVIDLSELAHLAAEAGVPVRLAKESIPDWTTPYGRLVVNVLGSVAEMEYELARERAIDTVKVRSDRGAHVGPAPYGSRVIDGTLEVDPDEQQHLATVVETYRRTRSYQATARELTRAGIPTKLRKSPWGATAVRQIIEREAPSLRRESVTRGRSGAGTFRFSGLIRCTCGATLTGRTFRGRYVAYSCRRAPTDPDHGRPWTWSEPKVAATVEFAVGMLKKPKVTREQLDAREAVLKARRSRVPDMYQDGAIDRDEMRRRIKKLDRDLDEVRRLRGSQAYAPRSLDGDPKEVNDWLREVFQYIQLGWPRRYKFALPEDVDWGRSDDASGEAS